MLARIPIISAYDPSTESMLAYASPSLHMISIYVLYSIAYGQSFSSFYKKLSTKQLIFIILQINPSFIPAKYF